MTVTELKQKVKESLDAAREVLKIENNAFFAGRVNAFNAVMKMLNELDPYDDESS